jgi:hypothetical protein
MNRTQEVAGSSPASSISPVPFVYRRSHLELVYSLPLDLSVSRYMIVRFLGVAAGEANGDVESAG